MLEVRSERRFILCLCKWISWEKITGTIFVMDSRITETFFRIIIDFYILLRRYHIFNYGTYAEHRHIMRKIHLMDSYVSDLNTRGNSLARDTIRIKKKKKNQTILFSIGPKENIGWAFSLVFLSRIFTER